MRGHTAGIETLQADYMTGQEDYLLYSGVGPRHKNEILLTKAKSNYSMKEGQNGPWPGKLFSH